MTTVKENIKPELGKGIYTIPDAAVILNLPKEKVRRWVKKYWEMEFLHNNHYYTWGTGRERAINFFTLMEIITVHSLREIGVSFPTIKQAHEGLAKILETEYPFAHARLMSDGSKIFYEYDKSLLQLDKKQQFSFKKLVEPYCKKIDFHTRTLMAERFWPLGKNHNVVVDPHHGLGQPVISGTNISVFTIINLIKAGETTSFIASVYELSKDKVEDARIFMKRIAA
ncbi:MAG TPA: DUF433 domain-containing protein [Balneolales bacterium]|nr:DUF433 domain-containing protein [Balneolales bacterium]